MDHLDWTHLCSVLYIRRVELCGRWCVWWMDGWGKTSGYSILIWLYPLLLTMNSYIPTGIYRTVTDWATPTGTAAERCLIKVGPSTVTRRWWETEDVRTSLTSQAISSTWTTLASWSLTGSTRTDSGCTRSARTHFSSAGTALAIINSVSNLDTKRPTRSRTLPAINRWLWNTESVRRATSKPCTCWPCRRAFGKNRVKLPTNEWWNIQFGQRGPATKRWSIKRESSRLPTKSFDTVSTTVNWKSTTDGSRATASTDSMRPSLPTRPTWSVNYTTR